MFGVLKKIKIKNNLVVLKALEAMPYDLSEFGP